MNKFKVGDRVRVYFSFGNWGHVPLEIKKGIVTKVSGNSVEINNLDRWAHYKQCRKLVKKESKSKFQVGDKVKILNCVPASYINSKGIVTRYNPYHSISYEVDIAGEMFTFRECDLELVNSVPKFQVGDFVRHVTNKFIIGQIIDIRFSLELIPLYIVEYQAKKKLREPFDIEPIPLFSEKELQKLNIKVED